MQYSSLNLTGTPNQVYREPVHNGRLEVKNLENNEFIVVGEDRECKIPALEATVLKKPTIYVRVAI